MTYGDETYVRRFWERVDKTDTCWLWMGALNSDGYGRLQWYGQRSMAHRVSYGLAGLEIADGLVLDHLCRVRNCVNPEHLEPVTQRVHVLRGTGPSALAASRTHCINGHELTDDNLAPGLDYRRCAMCAAVNSSNASRRARARNRGKGLPGGDHRHGTRHAYDYWGCRCEPCREASRQAWHDRKKAS